MSDNHSITSFILFVGFTNFGMNSNPGENILTLTKKTKKKVPIAMKDGGSKRTTVCKEPSEKRKK